MAEPHSESGELTPSPALPSFVSHTELQVSPLGIHVISIIAPGLQLTTFIDAAMMKEVCRRFLEAQKQAGLAASRESQDQSRALARVPRVPFIHSGRPLATEKEETPNA